MTSRTFAYGVQPSQRAELHLPTAPAAGEAIEFVELAEAGHMDFLDPASTAHARLCDWLARAL